MPNGPLKAGVCGHSKFRVAALDQPGLELRTDVKVQEKADSDVRNTASRI